MTRPLASVGTQPNLAGSGTSTRCRVTGPAVQGGRGVADRAAGVERGLLLDAVNIHPERKGFQVLNEHICAVAGGHDHPGNPGRGGPGQLMGEKRDPRGGQQRLGGRDGQRAQPGALAADEQDRLEVTAAAGIGELRMTRHEQGGYSRPCTAARS